MKNYFILQSPQKGPTILLVGGLHGDEITPWILLNELRSMSIARGKAIVVPFVNSEGLLQNSHEYPKNGIDLNREFDIEEESLRQIKSFVRQSDIIIDFHTHQYTETLPYAVIIGDFDEEKGLSSLARDLGLKYAEYISYSDQPERLKGTLFYHALSKGKKSIVVEMSNVADISTKDYGALKQGMRDMISGAVREHTALPTKLKRFPSPKAIIVTHRFFGLDDLVKKGDILFEARDINTGKKVRIVSKGSGILVTQSLKTIVQKDRTLYRLAE